MSPSVPRLAIEEADDLELAGQQRRLVDHEGMLAAAYDDEIVHRDPLRRAILTAGPRVFKPPICTAKR